MNASERIGGHSAAYVMLADELERTRKERDYYCDNLTEVQKRCTELKQQVRDQPGLDAFRERLAIGREKHPKGSALHHLVEEVGEVCRAMRRETPERVKDELLDVAVVAFRMYLGETAS